MSDVINITPQAMVALLEAEVTSLTQQLEEAKRDAERYRWIRGHAMTIFCSDGDTVSGNFVFDCDDKPDVLDMRTDEAIKEYNE